MSDAAAAAAPRAGHPHACSYERKMITARHTRCLSRSVGQPCVRHARLAPQQQHVKPSPRANQRRSASRGASPRCRVSRRQRAHTRRRRVSRAPGGCGGAALRARDTLHREPPAVRGRSLTCRGAPARSAPARRAVFTTWPRAAPRARPGRRAPASNARLHLVPARCRSSAAAWAPVPALRPSCRRACRRGGGR